MDELHPMLMELANMLSALKSLQPGEGIPRQLAEEIEKRGRELNFPDDSQQLKDRLKSEQRKMKANLKKLKDAAQGNLRNDSSSENSDSDDDDDDEVDSETGAFLGAAALGNTTFCSLMLQRGLNVNARGQKNATALHVATQENKSDVVNLLLSRGADVNAVDIDGDTALMIAVMKKHRSLTRLFIDRGTDLTWKNKKGFTAADLAFIVEDLETLNLIEQKKKSLQFDSKIHDETILSFAQKNSTQMIEFWLNNYPQTEDGPKPCDLQYKDGRTIAFTAALNGSEEMLALVDSLGGDLDLPDSTNSSPLFCAAQNGYETIVKMLLDRGCKVNRVRDTGRTALFSAIVNSHEQIVRILVEAGAEINIKDSTGTCPLACAIVCGSQEIFDYLLVEKQADCSVIDNNGNDLVLIAALYKRFQMLKQLHEHGLSLDAVNKKDGETPLLSACQVNCPEMVEYLADNGCNVNIVNKKGVTPVLRASFNNDMATVKLLARRRAQLDVPNRRRETAILVSAQKKSGPLVEYLYKKGCDISVIDKTGHTLAYYAATSSDLEMLNVLIRYSAPLDRQDKKGNTPLMMATLKPASLPIVQELVSKNCNVEMKNNAGNTACSIAAKQGSLDVLQYLDSIGEELVNISKKGKTIIMQASKRNQIAVLRRVKSSEAAMRDLEATCDLGRTAAHYAALGGHTEVLEFLYSEMNVQTDCKDAQGNTPFMLAIQRKHKEMAEKLNDLGADVNIRNKNGENAVHLAVQADSLELIRFLDQKGCYLDQEDKNGLTPLMLACKKKKSSIINFLISKNCFPKSFSKDGRQVIHFACESGKAHVVKRIIDLGVPVHAADSNGVTTLMLAAQSGSGEIIDILIKKRQQLVEMKDVYGKSALEYAIIYDRVKIIGQLIDAGCGLDNRLNDGRTPLLLAIQSTAKCADEMVQILMNRGCSTDAVTEEGLNAAHFACKYGKLDVLKKLIDKRISLQLLTKSGDSCLTLAVPKACTELIGLLIDADLDKNHCNENGHSAVSLACQRGSEEILSKLLPFGDAEIAKEYAGKSSLLHFACEGGCKKVVENLLEKNAALLEMRNSGSATPLHVACRSSKLELVDFLLQRGADYNAEDENGETPLFHAISIGNSEIVKLILDRRPNLSHLNIERVSTMAKAYQKGKGSIIRLLQAEEAPLFPERLSSSFEIFRTNLLNGRFTFLNELLNLGLPVDRREKDWHLIHLGIEASRSEVIVELLKRGASVRVKDSKGNTPLLSAIIFGRIDVAKQILSEHPETKDDVNNEGDTVLHVAVKENKLSTLLWLLSSFEFEKDVKNKLGQTALHLAALKGNVKMYDLLIKQGFSSGMALEDGKKKFKMSHLAAMSNNLSLFNVFRNTGKLFLGFSKHTPSVFEILAENGRVKVLQRLTEETGQNYDDVSLFGARNMAFFCGHESLCRWMINRGVDLERSDNYGETPISRSVQCGNFHLCRELIEKGKCDLSIKTKHGVSLVQKAVVADHEQILRYLIQRKAAVEEADFDGDTPLMEAVNLERPRILTVLHSEYKCNIRNVNKLKRNAAHLAGAAGNIETLKYLKLCLPNEFFSAEDVHKDTPLMLSALHGRTEAAKFLLENFPINVNHRNETQSTALHWAACKANVDLIKSLLAKGAEVDAVDKDGVTALMLAVQEMSVECVNVLMNSGASLTARNRYGDSVLALMLNSEESEIKRIGERLQPSNPQDTSHRTRSLEKLGHLTVESFHYYDHFPSQRPQESDEEEDELGDVTEASTAPQPQARNAASIISQSSVSRTSRPHRVGFEDSASNAGAHRRQSVEFPSATEAAASEPVTAAFSVHQCFSTGRFQLRVEAHSAEQRWLHLLQSALSETTMFPLQSQEQNDTGSGVKNLCTVNDLKFNLSPRPSLELTLDLPGERLSTCLDRIRDRDRNFHYLENEFGQLVAKQILAGLAYLHSKNLTHGRLKLASVWITDGNTLKLSDYGQLSQLAAYVANYQQQRYDPWTAPELRHASNAPGNCSNLSSQAADMWAFGCTLHEALIGCPPESDARDLSEGYLLRVYAAAQRLQSPVALFQVDRIFPAELAAIFKMVYAENPNDRIAAGRLLVSLNF